MTSLGLVEMTRKRTTQRLWQYYFDTCPLCHGTGHILSAPTAADRILEDLENRRTRGPFKGDLEITAPPEVAALLAKAPFKERLERTAGKEVAVKENPAFTRETYTILSV